MIRNSSSEKDISQDSLPGQISLPVLYILYGFFAQDEDASTAKTAGGSALQTLAGANIVTCCIRVINLPPM